MPFFPSFVQKEPAPPVDKGSGHPRRRRHKLGQGRLLSFNQVCLPQSIRLSSLKKTGAEAFPLFDWIPLF
jgi:hypothetical protein